MQKNECAEAWKQVTKIYDDTIDQNNPKITAQRIIDELGMNTAKEVFAVVAKIKQHDGRIYGKNREAMNAVPVNEDCIIRCRDNPMLYAGLDHIHTTHINNIITELLKVDAEKSKYPDVSERRCWMIPQLTATKMLQDYMNDGSLWLINEGHFYAATFDNQTRVLSGAEIDEKMAQILGIKKCEQYRIPGQTTDQMVVIELPEN